MKVQDNGCYYSVTANGNDIDRFKRQWPCNGFGSIRRVWAQWDKSNGDLVDLSHKAVYGLDEYAMACFVDDMKAFADKELGFSAAK